jgi:hypothetical protein
MRNDNNEVSQDEVLAYVNDVITVLDGEVALRSGQSRRIGTIAALTMYNTKQSIALKSGGEIVIEMPDTVAYVVNFADSAGFTIIAADTRIPVSVLAYVADGTLGTEVDDPGMAIFLEGLEAYIYESIVETELKRIQHDYLIHPDDDWGGGGNGSGGNPTYTTVRTVVGLWETTSAVYPLSPVEWNQDPSPFNDLVKHKGCSAIPPTAPAGCVAVATAHIMSYWEHPASIDGYNFDWNTLNQYTGLTSYLNSVNGSNYKTWLGYMSSSTLVTPQFVQNQVARLMERIGVKVGMSYSCNSSGASSNDAISYLKNIGYNSIYTGAVDYSYNTVITALNIGWPVYAKGYSKKIAHKFLGITIYYTYEGGHAWVIDGYLNRRRYVQKIYETWNSSTGALVSTTTTGYYDYWQMLHNNWGWGGFRNGYFTQGSFNASQDPDVDSNTTKGGEEGTPCNFQFDRQVYVIYK